MLSLTLNHKNKIRNEFLDSIVYTNNLSYTSYDRLVDSLHFLVIS